ncbi:MAG: hypothetical protein IAE90_07910 [Ignavibacteria bacterium]|nr:hypothetical protein [Ignavibacteria bacterium]
MNRKFKIFLPLIILSVVLTQPVLQAGDRKTVIFSALSDTIGVSSLTPQSADSIFSFIKQNSDIIDFDDCNICKSRAHIIARIIEKYFPHISAGKVWLIADSKRSSTKEIYRYKPVIMLQGKGSCDSWIYHVAPVLISGTDTIVIDPATQSKPVSLSTWYEGIIRPGGTGFIVIKNSQWYIYPEDRDGYFLDELHPWIENSGDLYDAAYLRSIDETLRAKHGFFEPWKFKFYTQKLFELVK